MKFSYAVWSILFVIAWMTAGFIPAIVIGFLAVVGGVSTGLHAQSLGSSSWHKELR